VAQQCQAPRAAGTMDPLRQRPYGDVQGSLTTEKLWIRGFINETYLWYKDVVPQDPAIFTLGATAPYVNPADNRASTLTLASSRDVVDTYFNSQRSLQFTATGRPKDQFHFTYATDEWVALSTAGTSLGFGFEVAMLASHRPRDVRIAYVEPGSPASANGLGRGAKFLSVNGVDVANGAPDPLNEGLFSPAPGKSYSFEVLDQGASTSRTVTMVAKTVTSTPVQNVRTLPAPYGKVGYLQFNDHIGTAEAQLIAAVNQLNASNNGTGISDLVLDLRYNGGGLLAIASELAYMLAGPAATNGKVFEKYTFNDKNPFNVSAAQSATPFISQAQGFSTAIGQSLPNLGLRRVFVLTGSGTCSASEAVINGLAGVGVDVILIGDATCGKPYGFYPQDNCSVTYFAIQLQGVNQLGFGDYADGFVPGGTGSPANQLKGCSVADDFTKPLGDVAEARLAAALQYRDSASCPPVKAVSLQRSPAAVSDDPGLAGRSALRQNRFLLPADRSTR
jgi:C-terminal processing protease CtpA/Prc